MLIEIWEAQLKFNPDNGICQKKIYLYNCSFASQIVIWRKVGTRAQMIYSLSTQRDIK